jgi:DNA primase catalytic core
MSPAVSGTQWDIAAIKLSYPLLDVVQRLGVALKRLGSHRWQGLCPFHEDRNPSFFLDAERQRFVCFGCKERGDVIDFVRLHERLNAVADACAWLAGTPPSPKPMGSRPAGAPPPPPQRRWDRLTLEQQLVLNAAGALYRDALWRNARARAYLTVERGLPEWLVRACGLGYADGRSLEAHLRKHGGLRVAEELGLLRRPEPGEGGRMLRERFAGRIVIPELRGGQPIWFLGRHPTRVGARVKYLGLPGEKPVLGFERAAGRREVYLIEGAVDWLTAVSWHLPAFSTCGTDFPSDRLGWLARARVIFGVLDADRAGRAASEHFEAVLGQRWLPISLPEGNDLNDLGCRPGGRAQFFRLVADARRTVSPDSRRDAPCTGK